MAFGSLKGGVGKTTLSLLAAEVAYRAERNVLFVDADIVGTEASEVVGSDTAYEQLPISLIEVLDRVPDGESVVRWVEKHVARAIADRMGPGHRRFMMSTFPADAKAPDIREWRTVLETSGLYVRRRMRDLVRACREVGLDVVVDLPAFDVGFARETREALEKEDDAEIYFITDIDVRSVKATVEHLRLVRGIYPADMRLIVNRVPSGAPRVADVGNLTGIKVISVPRRDAIVKRTGHRYYHGDAGGGLVDEIGLLYDSLTDDARRRLGGGA